MRSFRQKKGKGYTLIELLVSMAIAMVVLGALSGSFISQTKAYNAQENINEMQQNARAAMDLMAREIKMAGYDPTGASFAAVVTFASDQFRFVADVDKDGDTTSATEENEDITYSFDAANNQLLRDDANDGKAAMVVAENITALSFEYLMADGTTTATNSGEVRFIKITFTAQTDKIDPNTGTHQTYPATAWVTPNNLAY